MDGRSTDDVVGGMLRILDSKAAAGEKTGLSLVLVPPAVTCRCEKKDRKPTDMAYIKDPVLKCPVMADYCSGCATGKAVAVKDVGLICVKCKKVIARIPPNKDKLTGFEMRAGHYYHVEACPECTGSDGEYKILEKVLWNRKFYGRSSLSKDNTSHGRNN